MGDEPCDVGPVDEKPQSFLWNCQLWVRDGDGPLFTAHAGRVEASLDGYVVMPIEKAREMFKDPSVLGPPAPQRHHPNGIEPPELYEQWRAQERAKERDLMASCPDVKSYTQACRYMHAEPPKPEPFQAEGAVFARLIGNE